MNDPTCKDCIHYYGTAGLPGRCKLLLDILDAKAKDGRATVSELEYLARVREYDDEYWSYTCEEFKYKQGMEPITLTPEEVKALDQYIHCLKGDTVHIETASKGEEVYNRIFCKLRTEMDKRVMRAVDDALFREETLECSTQEKAEQ